jgi:hypothetical protein
MVEKKTRGSTSQQEAVARVRSGQSFAVNLPVLGRVTVPQPEQLAYYGGLVALAAFEIIDWPVAVAVAAGHILAHNQHNHALEQFGEALEES